MPWARFDDRFPSNRKIRMLGDGAFRLYVSAVCWSAENLTDGFIPQDELLLVSDTRDAEAACDELVKRKLWTSVAGGWLIHDYHEYNPAAEQVRAERKAKTARQERWRENKRRADAGLPPLPVDASPNPPPDAFSMPPHGSDPGKGDVDASTDASHDATNNAPRDTTDDGSQDRAPRARVSRPVPAPYPPMSTNTNPVPPTASPPDGVFEIELPAEEPERAKPPSVSVLDAAFKRFYAIYPRKKAPQRARTAWDKAIKNGTDPETLIAAAERYRDHCKRMGKAITYTPHPATWINDGSWDDDLEAEEAPPSPDAQVIQIGRQRTSSDLGGDAHMNRFLERSRARREQTA